MNTERFSVHNLVVIVLLLVFIHSEYVDGRPKIRAADKRFAFCGLNLGRGISKNGTGSEVSIEYSSEEDSLEDDEGRIVGGRAAKDHEVDYLVSVRSQGFNSYIHKCGGAIYSSTWIITAAHCTGWSHELDSYEIIAGDHHLEFAEESEQIIAVKKIIIHPYFDEDENNDIALLQLEKPLIFNQYVKPIKIPGCDYVLKGRAKVSGWGHLKQREIQDKTPAEYAHELQVAEVNVFSPKKCQEIVARGFASRSKTAKFELHENAFCAGHMNKTIDTCQGDSGGPLACHEKDGDILCGVVSFGFGCALHELPGIYTNVAHFHDWIAHVTTST